ncbi:MAG: hypothetical protein EPN47_13370 [Acidobacteria bacterium]|nr:MAG: hypothetical protein EPN47_13370 [Acidobacteriota bacterium]
MSDKEDKRDIGHAMFGFNEPRPSRNDPGQQTGSPEAGPAQAAPQGQAAPGQPSPPGQPQYVYVQAPPPAPLPIPQDAPPTSRLVIGVLALLVILAGVNLYLALSQRSEFGKALETDANQLTLLRTRMDASDDHYAQLKGQFDVTSEKLGMTQQELARARQLTATIQRQQHAAVEKLNTAIGQKASAQDLNKFQSDANNKFGSLSGDIEGNKKDLQATKDALTGTKGELSGAIARTHDELVALAHRTDRDYFEFNLQRRHDRKKIGSIMIELLKTNRKQNLYTIDLFFDDKRTQRKDQALDEPVYFYVQGAQAALELVVNKLDKDKISGYISAPKGFFQNTPSVLSSRPG